MYSGLKFFYGFCFLLLAYGFFIRNTKKDRILFTIFTCIAGGLHMMYYFFLVLLINPKKRPKYFVNIVVAFTLAITIIMRISGSAISFLAPFFSALDNDHVNLYTQYTVNYGFYIAVIIHIVVVYAIHNVRLYNILTDSNSTRLDALYYSSIISLIFCPFYCIALTFMRLITAFSLVVITIGSSFMNTTVESRNKIIRLSLIVEGFFLLMKLITGADSFLQMSVLPFFDIF